MTELTDTLLEVALVTYMVEKYAKWCFLVVTWLREELG